MYKEFLVKVENSEKRLNLMFSASIETHREFLITLNEIDNLTKGLDGIAFLNKELADNIQIKLSTLYTDLGVYLTNERERISVIVKGRSDRMKVFVNSIPNKTKALYLLWFGYHSLIFLIGERYFSYDKMFFPFSKVFISWKKIGWLTKAEYNTQITFDPKVYDFSELLIYILGPILIYAIIYLWQKKD